MLDKIRVASIGDAGHFYIAAGLGKIEGLEYVAAASDGYGGARLLANDPGIPVYEDYRRMLDAVRPDVASLGCWYAHNGQLALECLRRGIHVFTDKPALNSWEEWQEAREICAVHPQLCFLTEFEARLNPAFRAAHDAVREGRIGRPVLASAQKSYRFGAARPDFYRRREHFAGLVMWVASHGLDFMSWASGLD